MTSRQWDKALADVTYARIIERGPWVSYAKCWECGAEASACCVGDDGKEALVVCDGRELVIDDSAARCRAPKGPTRRDAPPDRRPQAESRRARGVLAEPTYAPCQSCGARTRLWGAAVETGRTWCRLAPCRKARRDARDARRVAAVQALRAEIRAALPPLVCWWCGVHLETPGRRLRPEYPCCGDPACRKAIKRDRQIKARAASQRGDLPAHA
jgi:hypothetical protein